MADKVRQTAAEKKDGLLVIWVKWLLGWNYLGYGKVKDF